MVLLGEVLALQGSKSLFSLLKGYVAGTVSCSYRSRCPLLLPTEPRFFSSTVIRCFLDPPRLQGKNPQQTKSIRKIAFLQSGLARHGLVALLGCKGTFTGRCLRRLPLSYKMERHFFSSNTWSCQLELFCDREGSFWLAENAEQKAGKYLGLGELFV